MTQEFEGRSTDAEAPFLGASFWTVGRSVRGAISKIFDSKPQADKPAQRCYVLELEESVEIDGEEWDRVSVGNLAGFKMAMQSAKIESLRMKDIVTLECDSIKPAKREGYSPRINFILKVLRS